MIDWDKKLNKRIAPAPIKTLEFKIVEGANEDVKEAVRMLEGMLRHMAEPQEIRLAAKNLVKKLKLKYDI